MSARADALPRPTPRDPATRRLIAHLRRERQALFTFLERPGVQATNWHAEQAIRPAVVIRKVWGGHRTWAGARVGQRLMTLIRTCRQRDLDPLAAMVSLQRAPGPLTLSLIASPPSGTATAHPELVLDRSGRWLSLAVSVCAAR